MQLQAAAATKGCTKFNEKVFSLPLFLSLHMKMLPIACESVRVYECVCVLPEQTVQIGNSHTHTHTVKAEQTAPQTRCTNIQCGGRTTCTVCACVCGHLWDNCSQREARGTGNRTGNWTWDMAITAHATWRNKWRAEEGKEYAKQNV